MKKLLTLIFISIALITTYAQNFQLTDLKGDPYTNEETISVTITEDDLDSDGEYKVAILVKNILETNLDVNTLRTNIKLVDDMSAYVCFGNCYANDVFECSWTIDAGMDEEYSIHLGTNGKIGQNKFKVNFSTPEQSMTLFVEINVMTVGINDYNNANVSLCVYPNPVSVNSTFKMAYTIADKSVDNRLVIRNIRGAKLMEIPLNAYENNCFLDASTLIPGVYFYAIENNNRISITKKLIVN
jgi:hypothetical protein